MGWYYTLKAVCQIYPEHINFICSEYLWNTIELENGMLNKFYKDLLDKWNELDINNFKEYNILENGKLEFEIKKQPMEHAGDLWQDYLVFMKEIILPISSEIILCVIESNDYGCRIKAYTDLELRGGQIFLEDIVKSIEHTWENNEIIETRVIYKHPIKKSEEKDLSRCYYSSAL